MQEELELYYFSGTGNTKFIVDNILKRLCDKKIRVEIYHIEDKLEKMTRGKSKMFVFPVNSQATSPFVWKFLTSLPQGSGEKVYIIITLNESSGIAAPLYKLFKKKGYKPVYFSEISMPNNMVNGAVDTDTEKIRVKKALEKCDVIAHDIISGKLKWISEYKGSKIVSFLSRNTNLPWISMRAVFKLEVNKEACAKCGLCEKQCPVGNIKLNENPIHKNKCQFCMRCIASCPQKAIYIKGKEKFTVKKFGDE